MSIRIRMFTLTLAGVLAASAVPVAADGTRVAPKMTHEQALKYIADSQEELTASNLVGPIMNGEADMVEALLSAGVDVNDTNELPKPAMRLAMQPCSAKQLTTEQMLVTIEVLLAHGAKVNEAPGAVLTPLIVATQNCPPAIINRLIKAGAEIDYHTAQGYTALSMALLLGKYDAAEALIGAGAKLSAEAADKLLENKKGDARLAELVKKARGGK